MDTAGTHNTPRFASAMADLVTNSIWNAIRLISALVSGVLVTVMLARYLGTIGMGAFSYALWLVGTVVFATNFGLPTTATRYIAECVGTGDLDQGQAVIRRVIGTQCSISLVASTVGLLLLLVLRVTPGVLAPIALMLIIGLRMIQDSMVGVLLGKQQFGRAAAVSMADATAKIGLMAAGIFLFRLSLPGLYVVFSAATVSSTTFALKMTQPRSWWIYGVQGVALSKELAKRMRKFSALTAYSLLLNAIVWQRSEVFFLKHLSDLTQVGIYAAGFSIATVLKAVPGVISDSLLPMAASAHRADAVRFREIYHNGVIVVLALMIPLAMLGIVYARPIVELLYGPRFSAAVPIVQVLVACSILTCLGGVGWAVMYASERQGFEVGCGSAVAILDVVLAVLLIPHYGAMGATAANSAAQVTAILLTLIYLAHYMGLELPYRAIGRLVLAAALAMAPAGMLLSLGWPMVFKLSALAAGIPLYLLLLHRFGVIGPKAFVDLSRNFLRIVHRRHGSRPAESKIGISVGATRLLE